MPLIPRIPPFLPLLIIISVGRTSAVPVNYTEQIKPLLQLHCVKCHGRQSQKNGLRLDTAEGARKGGEHGPAIMANRPADSILVQVVRGSHGEIPKMPYKRTPLDSAEIALIEQWIAEGAGSPRHEEPSDDRHWSFIPPQRPVVPVDSHPVDAFIRARLSEARLEPSPEAPPATLLRRLCLDLTGLPPSPAEVTTFEQAYPKNPSATFDATVTRLLASPHHGERWGRWWLDQARYADSNGYSVDAPRQMWKYRDWVIDAINRGMPFDQFSIEQIAGDLLPNATESQRIATGFHRNTQINQEGGIDKEQFRIESVFDRVATTGAVWLGLTTGCAQCHDHKFDPISHIEYYQLFAFLNNQEEPSLKVRDPGLDIAGLTQEQRDLTAKIAAHLEGRKNELAEWESTLAEKSRKLLGKTAVKVLAIPAEERTPADIRALYAAMAGTSDAMFNTLDGRLKEVEETLDSGTTTLVLAERAEPRETTLFIKGDFTRPADVVQPGVPGVLHSIEFSGAVPNRLDFARWLVDRRNPLTARVIMNRVWQQYFGSGLVTTENDFGTQGSLPTHPELLDWLACEFMHSGWDLERMHRLIVSSSAYRQSSNRRQDLDAADPNNNLLGRQNRLRLDAEVIRDVALTASGLLEPKLGGPPVFPPIPEGVMGLGQVKRTWPTSKGTDRYRRALYTFVYRSTPPPNLAVFDAPDGFATCTRRIRSNTPLQALTLLNDPAFVEFAAALEKRIAGDGLETAFRHCLAREPRPDELALLAPLDSASAARVLLNLDETITRE